MISGVMPRWRRAMHVAGIVLMGVVLAGLGFFSGRFFFLDPEMVPNRVIRVMSLLFIVLTASTIAAQFWFLHRIVREFTFDGTTLRYRTLGSPHPQTRLRSQLTAVKEWRGKGGILTGYRLIFREAPRAYLDLTVPNAASLAETLQEPRRD